MDTLFVCYDKSTGLPIFSTTGYPADFEAECSVIEVPEGQMLEKFKDGEPVFIDRPLTVEERLAQLEESQSDQDDAILEMSETIFGGEE